MFGEGQLPDLLGFRAFESKGRAKDLEVQGLGFIRVQGTDFRVRYRPIRRACSNTGERLGDMLLV